MEKQREGMPQVWVSYAYFEANPCEVLVAEAEIEEDQTEEQHAASVEELRNSFSDEQWLERQNAARKVYQRAFKRMREEEPDSKAEAALLLEEWLKFEKGCRVGTEEEKASNVSAVEKKIPKTVKKRRKIPSPGKPPAQFAGSDCVQEFFAYCSAQSLSPKCSIQTVFYVLQRGWTWEWKSTWTTCSQMKTPQLRWQSSWLLLHNGNSSKRLEAHSLGCGSPSHVGVLAMTCIRMAGGMVCFQEDCSLVAVQKSTQIL